MIWTPSHTINNTIKSQKNENNDISRNSAKQHPTETPFQPLIIVGNIPSALLKNAIKQVSFGVNYMKLFYAKKEAEVLESQNTLKVPNYPSKVE